MGAIRCPCTNTEGWTIVHISCTWRVYHYVRQEAEKQCEKSNSIVFEIVVTFCLGFCNFLYLKISTYEFGSYNFSFRWQTLQENGISGDIDVVIAGLSNTYADYITTPEEYSVQRYEGASTIYGPYTLPAYIQEFNKLAVALAKVGTHNLITGHRFKVL